MTTRGAWRARREPMALLGVALLGSAGLWGRLWVTSPTTRGVCGSGDPALERHGRAGRVLGLAVHVATPTCWRAASGPGVVVAYPYPGGALQSPLACQARAAFAVSMLGGSASQGTITRAGVDAAATAVLDDLSTRVRGRPTANAANAALVRAMLLRDGTTEVVVPVTEVLGTAPRIEREAWVFAVAAPLAATHPVSPARCAALAPCVLHGTGS